MPDDEEPDYEEIWRWIVASAEQHVEAQRRWQASWLEGDFRFDADLAYAAQRRAARAWQRSTLQQIDLALAINDGDIASYIERWYPEPTPNGASITFIHADEVEVTGRLVIDEVAIPEGWQPGRQYSGESRATLRAWYTGDEYTATVWESEDCRAARSKRARGKALVKQVSRWLRRACRMGPRGV